jgi:hypothetical protein
MVVVTVVIQVGFTVVGIRALRRRMSEEIIRSLWHSTLILAVFVLWLFLATVLQMWAWALLYLLLDAIEPLEKAVYFSVEAFTTVGYGDVVLDENWRLLASLKSANGLLMFGWSTALFFAAVQWIYERRTKLSQKWKVHQ